MQLLRGDYVRNRTRQRGGIWTGDLSVSWLGPLVSVSVGVDGGGQGGLGEALSAESCSVSVTSGRSSFVVPSFLTSPQTGQAGVISGPNEAGFLRVLAPLPLSLLCFHLGLRSFSLLPHFVSSS